MEFVYAKKVKQESPHYLFADLVDVYSEPLYKLCRRLTYSREDADDLFQETFAKMLEQLPKLTASDDPKGFLFSTALFIWKSWKRKYARRSRLVPVEPLDENIPGDSNVEDGYVEQEELQIVRETVEDLPDKFRIPTILYYTVEMSVPDIAAALKLPVGTVKSRLFKARKIVEKRLEAIGHGK